MTPRGMIPRRVRLPVVSYPGKSFSPGYHTPASQSPRGSRYGRYLLTSNYRNRMIQIKCTFENFQNSNYFSSKTSITFLYQLTLWTPQFKLTLPKDRILILLFRFYRYRYVTTVVLQDSAMTGGDLETAVELDGYYVAVRLEFPEERFCRLQVDLDPTLVDGLVQVIQLDLRK